MVLAFHNVTLDPQDIFQEGLTRTVINIRHKRFKGKSTFFTYLYSVCRNICLKELKRTVSYSNEYSDQEADNDLDPLYETIELLLKVKSQLDEICIRILDMRFQMSSKTEVASNGVNKPLKFEEIALQVNMNADNVRQRYRRCLEKLKKMVLQHPQFAMLVRS